MTTWCGKVPEYDDFGDRIFRTFYDAKMQRGPWAIMSPMSFRIHGIRLGMGLGQRYEKQDDGSWLKTAG